MRWAVSAALALMVSASAADAQASSDSLSALVANGDTAWERGEHARAFALYDQVVRTDTAFSTRALFRLGILHAWNNRLDASIACLRAYATLEPRDTEGRVALARTLAWAARYTESLAIYDSLAASGDALAGRKGRAQVLAWRGDLGLAEDEWRGITREHPHDADAWVGLAQVLRWAGRAFAAEDALEHALEITPDNRDAREQLRWVRVETKPQVGLTFVWADDSEDNTLFVSEARGVVATERNLRITGAVRDKSVGAATAPHVRATTATLALAWQPGAGAWTYSAELGAAQMPAISVAATGTAVGGVRATGRVSPRLRVSAGAGSEIFDEVRSTLDAQVKYAGADVDLSYAATQQLSLGLATSVGTTTSRTNSNNRRTMLGAARYSLSRGIGVALVHREVRWLEPEYGVFFAPQRFALSEASFSWARPGELGLVLGADVGLGSQSVRFESDPASSRVVPRGALRLGWRPVPGREVIGQFVYANVAGAGAITASEYRYAAISLTARWTF